MKVPRTSWDLLPTLLLGGLVWLAASVAGNLLPGSLTSLNWLTAVLLVAGFLAWIGQLALRRRATRDTPDPAAVREDDRGRTRGPRRASCRRCGGPQSRPPSPRSTNRTRRGRSEMWAPGPGVPVPPAERVLSRLGAARRRLS